MTRTEDLLAAAHEYRRRSWRVIQLHSVGPDGRTCSCNRGGNCSSAGKHPIDNAWQNSPAYSAADIEALWEGRPKANVGIATGKASGFWVLDIDPGTKDGMASMRELVAKHGALPRTWVAQTGSGGYHYAFKNPEDFTVRNDQSGHVASGIDLRGEGGQIVAPPSRSGKGDYVVITDAPIADAPAWLLELVRKPEHADIEAVTAEDLPKPEDIEPGEWDRLNRYTQKVLDTERARLKRLTETGWDGEPWNGTTFEVACVLIEFANSPWNAYSLGQAKNDLLTLAPRDEEFDSHTVAKIFASASDRVGQNARQVPQDRRQEPDPLFDGVPVRGNPTEGAGPDGEPRVGNTRRVYFGGEKGTTPIYPEMARGVMDLGPVGWGRDQDFWSYDDGVWGGDHYVVKHRLIDILDDAYKASHYPSTADVVQRHAQEINGDPLEPMMNFRNGMLDWREDTLVDHDPAYGSTVQFGTDWDPEAKCPLFEEFLADVMHEDYVKLAWEMLGYLMLSGNPQHVAFLFYGHGGNGKSTLIDVISTLLGAGNTSSETLDDLANNRFRTANLFGKIANLAGDIDATYQDSTAGFKRLTGEDPVTGEHKNMPSFQFVNWAVPVFSLNKFFAAADVSDGYLRRWIVLHFHKKIAQDKIVPRSELHARFTAELPGIAAKAVMALRDLMDRGHFDPQGEAVKAKEEFARTVDKVRAWVASGDPILEENASSALINLYASYSLWADRANQRRVSEQEFSNRLESIGYPSFVTEGSAMVYHSGLIVPTVNTLVSTDSFF